MTYPVVSIPVMTRESANESSVAGESLKLVICPFTILDEESLLLVTVDPLRDRVQLFLEAIV